MLSFQDLGFFVLNLTLRLRPEGVTRILSLALSLSLSLSLSLCLLFQRCLRGTPLGYGYCEQKKPFKIRHLVL